MTDWLKQLKVGDKVLVITSGGLYGPSVRAATVEKIGKLHFTVDGRKYRRTSGSGTGGDYWTPHLEQYDAAKLKAESERKARATTAHRLSSFNWRALDLKTLKAIEALLPKETP